MGNIKVVNKHYHTGPAINGDRSSVLGNRYSHLQISKAQFKVKTREDSIRLGTQDLYERLVKGEPELVNMIAELIVRYHRGEDLILGCWCKPLPCHLDYVKEGIENDIFIMIPSVSNRVSVLS